MAKSTFTSLKVKADTATKTITWGEKEIHIKQYLPLADKLDLCMVALQKSELDGVWNPILMDAYFHLHIVYMYTDISFSDKNREDEMKLYDALYSSGLMSAVINEIEEYNDLVETMNEYSDQMWKYKYTAAATIQRLLTELPASAESAAAIIDNFDKSKFQEVINFAEAANGGRNIVTNK